MKELTAEGAEERRGRKIFHDSLPGRERIGYQPEGII